MSNNAKVGGILAIVSGGLGIIGAVFTLLVIIIVVCTSDVYYYDYYYTVEFLNFMAILYIVIGLVGLVFGVLGIIGGVYALRRRRWGLALAGAIAGCVTFLPCGVLATVFVSMAKPEFSAK